MTTIWAEQHLSDLSSDQGEQELMNECNVDLFLILVGLLHLFLVL